MLRMLAIIVSVCFALSGFGHAGAEAQKAEPSTIRVGLWSGQVNVKISSDTRVVASVLETGRLVKEFKPKQDFFAAYKNNGIVMEDVTVGDQTIVLRVAGDAKDAAIKVNDRRYRGQIIIKKTKDQKGLTVVNVLPLEQYLYGVLPWEVSPDWPAEAVKAQAVAARSYAVATMGQYKDDGYDVTDDTRCQVYGGMDAEHPRTNEAVDKTIGLIMTYKGKPITAYFHASSGGYTENSENVWGNAVPYLRGVPDFDQDNPHFKWEKAYTLKDVEAILRKNNIRVGKLKAIQMSVLGTQPIKQLDRGVSGRVNSLKLIGSTDTVELSGNKVRSLFNLNSTLFDIAVVTPTSNSSTNFIITNADGEQVKKNFEIKTGGLETKKQGDLRVLDSGLENGQALVFRGFGWGHGLGMSQWGAKGMAQKGPKNDPTYFQQILKHYYQGIAFAKLY